MAWALQWGLPVPFAQCCFSHTHQPCSPLNTLLLPEGSMTSQTTGLEPFCWSPQPHDLYHSVDDTWYWLLASPPPPPHPFAGR